MSIRQTDIADCALGLAADLLQELLPAPADLIAAALTAVFAVRSIASLNSSLTFRVRR